MNDYLTAIMFFLPAGISNMSPILANHVPILNKWSTPIDFGYKINDRRIFGDNKRWRGIVSGTIMGGLTAVIVSNINPNTITNISPFIAGMLLGFGALTGDTVESFFKRKIGIKPGNSWFPFDQTDYIFGGLIVIYPFVQLPMWVLITVLVTYLSLHLVFAYVAYLLGLKDKPI